MIYRVPLQVAKAGCSLHWKFKTDPKVLIHLDLIEIQIQF